jgi:hypothetical protein
MAACPRGPDTVEEWIAPCAELGVSPVFWYVNYVGKATYHSDVLPRMMSVTSITVYQYRCHSLKQKWSSFDETDSSLVVKF